MQRRHSLAETPPGRRLTCPEWTVDTAHKHLGKNCQYCQSAGCHDCHDNLRCFRVSACNFGTAMLAAWCNMTSIWLPASPEIPIQTPSKAQIRPVFLGLLPWNLLTALVSVRKLRRRTGAKDECCFVVIYETDAAIINDQSSSLSDPASSKPESATSSTPWDTHVGDCLIYCEREG